ncbi:DUF1489 family protein [Sphingomonas sp.]|uniref:DUF1489 family protein n=1 Tax=Sphingomonas sp. TaxID=28214 RepID=UPI00286D0B4C|nr:DUF1489 family protein [Sphingomonas sp.]
MPNLHLTKVAFGCRTIEALEKRVAARTRDGEVRIATRMRPKRSDELIGGSIYWIIKHRLVACQQILRLDDRNDGRIDIVCSGDLILIPPSPRRAHQGWRYLEDDNAPSATGDSSGIADLPPRLYGKLATLALL